MFKIFEPNKIFLITSKAPKYVLSLFIVVLSIGLVEALILFVLYGVFKEEKWSSLVFLRTHC